MQMDAVMRGGALGAAGGNSANPYGINTQAIAAQAQAAGQKLAQDPQVMALSQQYAAKAQAGTLTPQEQQQYAMLMLQNPAVQQQMQGLTGNVLGQMQSSGAINQATAQAMSQGMAQAGNMPAAGTANPFAGLFGGMPTGSNAAQQDMYMTQQLMLQSKDPKVRAAASDPQSVAQYAAVLRNPQLAVAAQRAAAAGVNPAFIQSQLSIAGAAQQAAAGGYGGQAPGSAGAIAAQGDRYRQLVASGMPWQQALAQAQAETGSGAAVQPQQGAAVANGLLGALAANGSTGGQQAAGILGSLFAGAQQRQAAQAAAPTPTGNPALATQAQARKEHLTSMFLSKGCKMSDVQR
jgi:hypothetical protein